MLHAGKTMAEVTALALDASRKPKKGLTLVLRHVLGPLIPSWWSSLFTAIGTNEPDAFFYGPEGVAHKRFEELARRAEHDCYLLKQKVDLMNSQMKSAIYIHKCARCSP